MDIKKQIEYFKGIIQDWEDTDPAYLNEEIKDLRHKTMFIHLRLEAIVELLIRVYILSPTNYTSSNEITHAQIILRMDKVFNKIDFAKKITIAQEFRLISDNLVGRLHDLNEIRKYFSHPKSYENKIKEFNKPENYLKALKILYGAFDGMNKLLEKYIKNE